MIREACNKVADKIDFSKYDSDGDKFVDLVYIIYAGYSQSISGNSDDYLWPKSGSDNFYKYDENGKEISPRKYLIYNGCRISRFGINNELNGSPDSKFLPSMASDSSVTSSLIPWACLIIMIPSIRMQTTSLLSFGI